MSLTTAQQIHDRITADGGWPIWVVWRQGPGYVARAMVPDPAGGHSEGEVAADTLDELRAMLPAGLTRWDRRSFDPVQTVEVWG